MQTVCRPMIAAIEKSVAPLTTNASLHCVSGNIFRFRLLIFAAILFTLFEPENLCDIFFSFSIFKSIYWSRFAEYIRFTVFLHFVRTLFSFAKIPQFRNSPTGSLPHQIWFLSQPKNCAIFISTSHFSSFDSPSIKHVLEQQTRLTKSELKINNQRMLHKQNRNRP